MTKTVNSVAVILNISYKVDDIRQSFAFIYKQTTLRFDKNFIRIPRQKLVFTIAGLVCNSKQAEHNGYFQLKQ